MKAVLLSVNPNDCELIAQGRKTIIVKKTRPNISADSFKCYIYCTKSEPLWQKGCMVFTNKHYNRLLDTFDYMLNGKIIGEFICDRVDIIDVSSDAHNAYSKESCLTVDDFINYCNGQDLYGWYISNLVIYDEPKELSEFRILDKEKQKACVHRERYYTNPDWTNSAELPAGFTCDIGTERDFCRPFENKNCTCFKPMTHPPQPWCYVDLVE